jgi:serine/threonine-protein kinase
VTDVKGKAHTVGSRISFDDALPNDTGVRPTSANTAAALETERFEVIPSVATLSVPGGAPANDQLEHSGGRRAVVGQQTPVPGMVIAQKYELGHRLGQGGMGSVWTARDRTLDIDVALKLLRRELVTPVLARRMLREARTAAKFRHPAIVRITDFGTADGGVPFLVMELLRGESLSERIRRMGRLDPDTAIQLLLPVAHGLEAAHRNSVVHRDLKPENVLLAELDSGVQPKLLDFGVAKVESPGQTRLTSSGVAVGSPSYMSPEQAQGLEADARSDIWSFCVVLYEAVTGVLPFTHANHNGLMQCIINSDPEPLSCHGLRVPGLWPIVERGLSKDPLRRWQSMCALGRELAMWLLARGITEDATGRSLRSAWLEGDPSAAELIVLSEAPISAPALPLAWAPHRLQWLFRTLQARRFRYGVMPAVMAIVGGVAGWYLRTHDSGRSPAAQTTEISGGAANAHSERLSIERTAAKPDYPAMTPDQAAVSVVENHGIVQAGLVRPATSVESANARALGASRDPAPAPPGHGFGSSSMRSGRGAAPAGAGIKPGTELDIKTEF